MNYNLCYTKQALKDIRKLSGKTKTKIEKALKSLAQDPLIGKPLLGSLVGKWSLRVADYRITYEIRKSQLIVLVLMVGPRQDIYKRLLRFLDS